MIREILFKGKRKDNGEWVEGRLLADDVIVPKNQEFELFANSWLDNSLLCHIVIPETVGQYTGLTDKNGKKIFEGDIVKYQNKDGIKLKNKLLTIFGKVVYNNQTASFAVDGIDNIGGKQFDYFPINNIEVIGNIHDNPELLGGAE